MHYLLLSLGTGWQRCPMSPPPAGAGVCHGMGLMVTAEGVETEAEKATITRLGCDVMQGYLGSRPLHGAALQAWFGALGSVDVLSK